METIKNEHGTYFYEDKREVGFTNGKTTWIARGRYVSEEEFNKEFKIKKEVKQPVKKQVVKNKK